MKRGLVVGFVIGLAVALAAPAMAIDWSASGFTEVTGVVFRNAERTDAAWVPGPPGLIHPNHFDEGGAYLAMRNRLKLTAKASKDLSGVLYFEIDSMRFGSTGAGRNNTGAWGGDQVSVEVKNCYIDFRVPQTPIWMRAGLIPFAYRPGVFWYRDGSGVASWVTIDPIKMKITGAYGKIKDPNLWSSEEGAEAYLMDVNLPVGPLKVGGHFTYQNERNTTDIASNYFAANQANSRLWWLGGYADGKVGPVNVQFDVIYNGGSSNAITGSGAPDYDYGAWLAKGEFSFVRDKLEVGLGGMYVTGMDWSKTKDISAFVLPGLSSEACGICGDTVVMNTGWMDTDPGAAQCGALSPNSYWPGWWNLRVFAYYQVTDWLKFGAQVAYFGDTVKDGDAFDGPDAATLAGAAADDDNSLGWEFDFGVNINIYKNLAFNGAVGYVVAGKALKTLNAATGLREDPKDPYLFVGSLLYTF
jgi:hypothetical protein